MLARGRCLLLANISLALLASLCASQVDAGLFDGKSSYERFANDLYAKTQSNELEANKDAARALYMSEGAAASHIRDKYNQLVHALEQLKGTGDRGASCNGYNLARLRVLAEAMRRGGNLGPGKISKPIRHLNRLIIEHVADARSVCFRHLDEQYPSKWPFLSLETDIRAMQTNLDRLPQSYLFEGYLNKGLAHKPDGESIYELQADSSAMTRALLREMKKYVYKPCEVFLNNIVSSQLLKPYLNLLLASFIVTPNSGAMSKFYSDTSERPHLDRVGHKHEVLRSTFEYQACIKLVRLRTNTNWQDADSWLKSGRST